MARRVFFSFHFDWDIFRANQVRNSNVVLGPDRAGFFDHSEYEEAKKTGGIAIRRMILRHLENTTVTVILIGTFTANRPWVQFEIDESVKRKNGLLGIRIHHLKNQHGYISPAGSLPVVPTGVVFPVHNWDPTAGGFSHAIETAAQRSEAMKGNDGFSALARLLGSRRSS